MKFRHYLVEYRIADRVIAEVVEAVSRMDSMKQIVKQVPHCVILSSVLCD
jgi:hypothetical protein